MLLKKEIHKEVALLIDHGYGIDSKRKQKGNKTIQLPAFESLVTSASALLINSSFLVTYR